MKQQPDRLNRGLQPWRILFSLLLIGMLFTLACWQFPESPTEALAAVRLGNAVPAFPGAEGFGAYSVGGRGGQVIEVTNLNDSGPGSLREAIDTEGPRIVVFRVGGAIELKSRLDIVKPYITVAGQTAPGGGILLRNAPGNKQTPIRIKTHDVVLRYIRSRPGPSLEQTDTLDALEIKASQNVIVDHSSFSWSTDENVNIWENSTDITIQWSIIAEGLQNSTHIELKHSKGLLIGSEGAERISIHHNLFAHNWKRNPKINTSGVVDVVNNVIYNTRDGIEVQDTYASPKVNIVGNFFKRGPANFYDYDVHYWRDQGRSPQLYVQGNIGYNRPLDNLGNSLSVRNEDRQYMVEVAHKAAPVTTTSACMAYEQVLLSAGATVPKRDKADERIVFDVVYGTGDIIDHPDEVGGWPVIAKGEAPPDSDHDGMADVWEEQHGLNPQDDTDGALDLDTDGYTNVEEYLNGAYPAGEGPPQPTPTGILPKASGLFYLPYIAGQKILANCE